MAALLGALFADSDSDSSSGGQLASSVAVDTDAALDVLFNSGYDVEGKAGQLSAADMERMKGLIASTSAALRLNRKDVTLLLRRAALCVALGEPALARQDYERVLALDPANPEALKYVDLANYGANFDPYTILGVPRSADTEVVSMAFRRLAKQWHPDRWYSGSEAEQAEAETRFKQLNLAQAVLTDAAKRKRYDAGNASVADLMVGWWDKVRSRWGIGGAKSKAVAKAEEKAEARVLALPPEGGASPPKR